MCEKDVQEQYDPTSLRDRWNPLSYYKKVPTQLFKKINYKFRNKIKMLYSSQIHEIYGGPPDR